MKLDFVFPHGNEEEFVEIGTRLGYDKIVFIYNYGENIGKIKEKLSRLKKADFGLLAFPKNIKKAQKLTKYVLVQSGNEDRFVFEKNKDVIVFGLEGCSSKEFIHHRASGLNHVLCSFAHSNDITVAFSFNSVLKADARLRALILGRMKQSVKLCRKYKVKNSIYSFANEPYEMRAYKDMESFL